MSAKIHNAELLLGDSRKPEILFVEIEGSRVRTYSVFTGMTDTQLLW